eukprot:4531420-Pyramimonas_sp.AAC.1
MPRSSPWRSQCATTAPTAPPPPHLRVLRGQHRSGQPDASLRPRRCVGQPVQADHHHVVAQPAGGQDPTPLSYH